jgi:hypothetical protein
LVPKEKKFGPWVKERKIKVPSTEFTVEGLREGVDYYFRLLAENDEGSSKPVETSQVIQLTKVNSVDGTFIFLSFTQGPNFFSFLSRK